MYMPTWPTYRERSPSSNDAMYRNPGEHDIPYENYYLSTDDKKDLHAWYLKHPNPK